MGKASQISEIRELVVHQNYICKKTNKCDNIVLNLSKKNTMQAFDVIMIGGGSTGLGVALEAASRGYKTLVLEACDYGKGTSSKSTKLVHGGIRYLANFDFALVKEGLEERYYFLNNAPHLAHAQSYLIPFHNLYEKLEYHIGIRLYDFLAGRLKIGSSRFLSKRETLREAPDLNPNHIAGGGIYFDGQFDDTRMLVTLLRTFESFGGVAHNYHCVTDFVRDERGQVVGVKVHDRLQDQMLEFKGKVVINATGIFTDSLMNLAEPGVAHHAVEPAQGTHLVFDRDIFDCSHALVIPKTVDGRILFVLPWHDKVLVGTTDVEMDHPSLDPIAGESEIDLILNTLNEYTRRKITRADIKSIYVGQRPLVKPARSKNSKKVSRKHEIFCNKGLISIVGGKWTIYRRMGEDTINYAIAQGFLPSSTSKTKTLQLFGHTTKPEAYPLSVYGTDFAEIAKIQTELNNFAKIHPALPYLQAEVVYQIRYEQAKTIEDVLARRTRALFLDAKAATEAAPLVANLMAKHLNKDKAWVEQQLEEFYQIANGYLPHT